MIEISEANWATELKDQLEFPVQGELINTGDVSLGYFSFNPNFISLPHFFSVAALLPIIYLCWRDKRLPEFLFESLQNLQLIVDHSLSLFSHLLASPTHGSLKSIDSIAVLADPNLHVFIIWVLVRGLF